MKCPDEFAQAQYADGELPEAEAQELIEHFKVCDVCRERVAALKTENRLLIQSLQGIDLWEPEPEPVRLGVPESFGIGVFATAFVATAILLRMGLGFLLGIEVPSELDWLYPLSFSGQLNWLANGFVYIIREGGSMVTSIAGGIGFMVFGLLILGTLLAANRRARGITTMVGLTALMFAFVVPGYAIDIRRAEKGLGSVSVAANETVNDTLVVFADSVNVNGTITGDLIAFGRQVNIRGTVQGNVIGFAQRIEVTGNVEGDIFGFGQSVQTNGRVGRNLWVFGQAVTVGMGGGVEHDATLFGADLNVDGAIGRDLTAFGAVLGVGSAVGRDISFRGQRLSIRAPSKIGRDLYARVQSEKDVQIDPSVTIAGKKKLEMQQPAPNKYATYGFYIRQLLRIGAAFLIGLLLFWLFPGVGRVPLSTGRAVLTSGGIGFMVAVATPVAVLILAITLIGIPIALVALGIWLLGLYLAKIVIARCLGSTILGTKDEGMSSAALNLLIGLVIVIVAVNLPYIGGIVGFLLILIGFGALVTAVYQKSKLRQI